MVIPVENVKQACSVALQNRLLFTRFVKISRQPVCLSETIKSNSNLLV
uniref:Uncharacterized protein n=1 Tax=Anguilla anguilla TaxID=7936 RepID=A0A0E9S0F3_ANGAN